MPYVSIFGFKFRKTIAIIESSTLKLFELLPAKLKISKSVTKNAFFGYFWASIGKKDIVIF